MIDSKGEIVTDFFDSVGTTSVSYTYNNTQTSLFFRNESDVSITVTINASPTVVARYTEASISAEFTSFSVQSSSGMAAFYVRTIRGVPTNNVSSTSLNIISGTETTPSISAIGDANTGIYFPAAETIGLTTNGSEKVRVSSTGSVGIGTKSPTRLLDVSSAINTYQRLTTTIDASCFLEFHTNGTLRAQLQGDGNGFALGSVTNTPIYFNTNNTEKMRLTAVGNLGIGITPTQKLHVYDANSVIQLNEVASGGTGVASYRLKYGTNHLGFYVDSANALVTYDYQAGAERMRIDSTGKVGIGVTPNATLHAKSSGEMLRLETTSATGDNFIRFYAPSSTTQAYVGYTSAANNDFTINNIKNNAIWFGTNNIDRLYVEAGGTTRPATNNTYDLGSSTYRWATIYSQNSLNVSDARLKTDVQDSTLGLDFISNLRPVQYKFIEGRNEVTTDENGEQIVTTIPGVRTHFGLIAQEVKNALPTDLDFAGWCLADKEDSTSTQSLGYTELIAPMIKAIQELKTEIESLKAQLNA